MKRVKTVRNGLKNLGKKSMTTHEPEAIKPIISSGDDEYQISNENDNDSLSETRQENDNQEELNDNLRILQRQRGIEQLVVSESKYCNNLRKLINLYFEPLSKYLSSPNQFTLFGDIKTIYEKNVQFSIALEQKYKSFNPTSSLIADEILKFFNPNLRILYQNYVNRHEEASKLLVSLQTDSKFVKICDEAQKNKKQRNGTTDYDQHIVVDSDNNDYYNNNNNNNEILLTIKHLLLLPIHRIGKYESLIKHIISNTDETHNDYNNLQQCLRDIIGINQLINDKMKEFSEREVVRKIANAIKGHTSLKLETPYRKFIKNGYLIKMGKTKPQRYLFFLFNDLLFYCKKIGNEKDENKDNKENNNNNNKEREDSHSKSEESKDESDKIIDLRPASNPNPSSTSSTSSIVPITDNSGIGLGSTVAHDYSDTSDLHEITSLFGPVSRSGKSRKSRTKLFSDTSSQSEGEDELSMTSFGMNVDIHNEIDVYNLRNLPQFKIHNYMPIDMAFDVKDFRILPQRYDNQAFEIRSSVKSFIVVAESDRAKKEWMTLLEHCTNQLFQLSLTNKVSVNHSLAINITNHHHHHSSSSTPSTPSISAAKMKKFAATLYLPTNFTEQCMKCHKQFGYSRRKNHCHHCGWLVCSKCLTEKLPSFDTIKGNLIIGGNQALNTNNKSTKNNQTLKVCDDCYTKNKHFFPEFEEASALSTNAKSKIFAYKQKSKRKQFKNKKKKNKKSKFKIFSKSGGNGLIEDAENDDFYERGSLKDKNGKKKKTFNPDIDDNEDDEDGNNISFVDGQSYFDENEDDDDDDDDNDVDDDDDDDDDDDEYDNSDIEPSMHSIPENDDHIEILIGHNDYEPSVSSQLLAPHWTPHAAPSGHHNRDFSHNLNESGYADNDSDSDKEHLQNQSDLTPPVSDNDIPVSPYYEDTPLMDGKANNNFDTFTSPHLTPRNSLELRPQNSLNMGGVLDELEREQQQQQEREREKEKEKEKEKERERENEENKEKEREERERMDDNDNDNDNDNDDYNNNDYDYDERGSDSDRGVLPAPRQSSLMYTIPENEDTDDETSANDTDAATAYEHMRNLSTHIEEQEYQTMSMDFDQDQSGYDQDDSDTNFAAYFDVNNNNHNFDIDDRSIIHGGKIPKNLNNVNVKINIDSTKSTNISMIRNQSHDSPGNTPPPVSPRYKKMSTAHKRKLSDKLDRFLTDRQNPQQLIQKHILYTTPEEDIESVKEKIQIKREERDKIKKRLKRKLSHDFRPTEQDIEERGIKIVPEVIRSDEEDMDEEIIVYDNKDNRNSFSLQKKKSIDPKQIKQPKTPTSKENINININKNKNKNKNKMMIKEDKTRDSISSIESADFASMLQDERKRNSKKIQQALIERPAPSDIIEKGYISAQNINDNIPTQDIKEQIKRYKAELKLEIIENNQYKMKKEKINLRKKRRAKILNFYDNYLFNYIFDEDDDDDDNNKDDEYPLNEQYVDIDNDYQCVLNVIQNEHIAYNKNDKLFSKKEIFAELYSIRDEEISLEKEWMRNLRKRKFKTYINKNKCKILKIKRDEMEIKVNELSEQIEIVENTQKIDAMTMEIKRLEKQTCILVENTSKQIDDLRNIIKNLNKLYNKKTSFISVS